MKPDSVHIADINTAEKFSWGEQCSGWHFVNTEELSVIRESMPGGTSEKPHFHEKAGQFFYILNGVATFEIEDSIHELLQNQEIHIPAGIVHQISNKQATILEFLVVSQPKSHGDRVNMV